VIIVLSERLSIVLKENKMKQKEFASSVGVSENYISLLLNNKKENVSESLAKLIEEKFGFSADWLLTGEGQMRMDYSKNNELSPNKKKAIEMIAKLDQNEAKAVLAFLKSLEDMKES
jgi:transcriptional regulator with XRE-family HTH domain